MKTVVQVVQHLCPGGIETMALDLATFHALDEKVLIVSLEGEKDSAMAAWPRLEPFADRLFFLNKEPGLKPALIYRLCRLMKRLKADVVHTHHIGPLLYGGMAARLAGIGHIVHTEHDAWHLNDKRRLWVQRQAIRLIRPRLVADAEYVARQLRELLAGSDICVIRNGIDTERFIPGHRDKARYRFELPLDGQLVGCSGRLEPVKDQQTLISALTLLPKTIHLALAGTGSDEMRLKALANTLQLDGRVHFLGRVDDMPTFYQALDVFCLPSKNEGFPLSPLEAQACGIPTLVTDVGGASETLCPDNGCTVTSGDKNAMADKLLSLLADTDGRTPEHFVRQQGDVRQMANAYVDMRKDYYQEGPR